MQKRFTYILIVLFITLSCAEKVEIEPKSYPTTVTQEASNINGSGATLNATFSNSTNSQVVEYGFYWSIRENKIIENGEKRVIQKVLDSEKFSYRVVTTLITGATYYFKAFVKTEDITYFGITKSFQSFGSSGPIVSGPVPNTGTIGDTIVIKGKNFSYHKQNNQVKFEDQLVPVINASDTTLSVVVPSASGQDYAISVSTTGKLTIADQKFTISTPIINNIQPQALAIDDTLTIIGNNFSFLSESNVVRIGSSRASVVDANKTQLKVIVPSHLEDGDNTLSVSIGTHTGQSPKNFNFKGPKILSIGKSTGAYGELISINGQNFSHIRRNNAVSFWSNPSYDVQINASTLNGNKTTVNFLVPDNLTTSSNTVILEVAGRTIEVGNFQIDKPEVSEISPNVLSTFDLPIITISGKNFNTIEAKNSVTIRDVRAQVISATHTELVVQPPRNLIPFEGISVSRQVDLDIQVLDQSLDLENAISIQYESSWTKMIDFPGEWRRYAVAEGVEGIGYVGLGGSFPNEFYDFWAFDPRQNQWTQKADFPGQASYRTTSFTLGHKIYVVGGSFDRIKFREFWEYDTRLDQWTQKQDFPGEARVEAFSFTIGNKAFIGGGHDDTFPHFNDFWEYDPITNQWTKKNDLDARDFDFKFMGFSINNLGYVHGYSRSIMWRYDPNGDTWERWNARSDNSGVFTVAGSAYFGHSRHAQLMNVYNAETQKWTLQGLQSSSRRTGPTCMSIDGKGYIMFGSVGFRVEDRFNLWQFDPDR